VDDEDFLDGIGKDLSRAVFERVFESCQRGPEGSLDRDRVRGREAPDQLFCGFLLLIRSGRRPYFEVLMRFEEWEAELLRTLQAF